jgi:hypothetical protein
MPHAAMRRQIRAGARRRRRWLPGKRPPQPGRCVRLTVARGALQVVRGAGPAKGVWVNVNVLPMFHLLLHPTTTMLCIG